jgi:hypothetical protein
VLVREVVCEEAADTVIRVECRELSVGSVVIKDKEEGECMVADH